MTTVTAQLRAQFGLVSAGRFPPHATLAGSLAVAAEPALTAVLDRLLARRRAVGIRNAGVARLARALVYDLHRDGGGPNGQLVALAEDVQAAVAPLLRPTPAGSLPSDVPAPGAWRGHLSLASHELDERTDLDEEVEEYVTGLGVPVPDRFRAEWVGLYRQHHRTWSGRWWRDFTWEHVCSWRLATRA